MNCIRRSRNVEHRFHIVGADSFSAQICVVCMCTTSTQTDSMDWTSRKTLGPILGHGLFPAHRSLHSHGRSGNLFPEQQNATMELHFRFPSPQAFQDCLNVQCVRSEQFSWMLNHFSYCLRFWLERVWLRRFQTISGNFGGNCLHNVFPLCGKT